MKITETTAKTLGIPSTYKGYHYLITTLDLFLERGQTPSPLSTVIFPMIATKHQTTPTRVERNLRTLITVYWESDGQEKLMEMQ